MRGKLDGVAWTAWQCQASIEMSPFVIDEDPGVTFAFAPFPLSK